MFEILVWLPELTWEIGAAETETKVEEARTRGRAKFLMNMLTVESWFLGLGSLEEERVWIENSKVDVEKGDWVDQLRRRARGEDWRWTSSWGKLNFRFFDSFYTRVDREREGWLGMYSVAFVDIYSVVSFKNKLEWGRAVES